MKARIPTKLNYYLSGYAGGTVSTGREDVPKAHRIAEVHESNSRKDHRAREHAPSLSVHSNDPITDIRLRESGGIIFQLGDGWYSFTVWENILREALITLGCKKGGILRGQYIFAEIKGRMKLIRIGSDLHRKVVRIDEESRRRPIRKADLKVGYLYRTAGGKFGIYLGEINYQELVTYRMSGGRARTFNPTTQRAPYSATYTYTWELGESQSKVMLWYSPSPWRVETTDAARKSYEGSRTPGRYSITKSHTYRVNLGKAITTTTTEAVLRLQDNAWEFWNDKHHTPYMYMAAYPDEPTMYGPFREWLEEHQETDTLVGNLAEINASPTPEEDEE